MNKTFIILYICMNANVSCAMSVALNIAQVEHLYTELSRAYDQMCVQFPKHSFYKAFHSYLSRCQRVLYPSGSEEYTYYLDQDDHTAIKDLIRELEAKCEMKKESPKV